MAQAASGIGNAASVPTGPRGWDVTTWVEIGVAAAAAVVSGVLHAAGGPAVATFVAAGAALAALAALIGLAVEQVGEHLGPGTTGLIQSTLGNLPELFVGIFSLRAGLVDLVRAALVGSVLANCLFVLGLAFFVGGLRHGPQPFHQEAPRMISTLLLLAVAALAVPTLAFRLHTPAAGHAEALSDACSLILLAVYLASVPFWLAGSTETGPSRAEVRDSAWSLSVAVAVLAVAGGAAGFVSDWFVEAIRPSLVSLHLSETFTGLVVVAIAANAVENAVGVRFAARDQPEFAVATILNSPLQVALLLTPALVLAGPLMGGAHLTLVFPPLLVVALIATALIVTIVVYDGVVLWLEGLALIALYGIIAAAFWWG